MKLKIKNFQSAEDCHIEIPEKAFTCLVGPTNIGKSAIRRALECILYNKSEISYIRNGTSQCAVELTFDDGTHIKWMRDKKTAYYEVNGESFSKLAGSVPEILLNKGFRELTLSKDKLAVQVAHQFENIFLLNQPGGKITEVLSNLGNLNRIIEANKACQTDKKAIKSKLKIRAEDLSLEKDKISSFDDLESQNSRIKTLKDTLFQIKKLKNNKEILLKISGKLHKSMKSVSELRKIKDITIPSDDINLENIKTLRSVSKKYFFTQTRASLYKNIKNVNDLYFKLDDDLAKFANLQKLYKNISVREQKISFLTSIPEIIEDLDIDLRLVSDVKKLQEKLEFTKKSVLNYRTEIKEAEEYLKCLEVSMIEIKRELKVCPLCDSNLCLEDTHV